jgi:hypothetical protein
VGLYAAGAPDNAFQAWWYLAGTRARPETALTEATLHVAMPTAPGTYEFRLFANDGFVRLATSDAVTVISGQPPTITTSSAVAVPGEAVTVTIANGPGDPTDWVGLYESGAADHGFQAWWYLNGLRQVPGTGLTDAALSLAMPMSPGIYELRLFANNTFVKLATSLPIAVSAPPEAALPSK